MFAVVRTGGKQYRVSQGTELNIEKLEADIGADVTFEDILLVCDGESVKVGQPCVGGASVTGEVVDQFRGEKKIIFKKLRRKNKRLKQGHRQSLTRVRVKDISC